MKQLNLYRLYELLQLKQLSAEVSGTVKTLAKVGTRDNTIKRHLMKREQLCLFATGESKFHLLDKQYLSGNVAVLIYAEGLAGEACLVLVRFCKQQCVTA